MVPRLSVVVPNYNHSKYLTEAIEALLKQSLSPHEIIIVDDASTDDSVQIVNELMNKHSTIRLLKNVTNRGVIESSNRGTRLATGDYLYMGAADDRVCDGLFEKSVKMLEENPSAGLCSALISQLSDNGDLLDWVKTPVVSSREQYFSPSDVRKKLHDYGFWFTGHTTILRRSAIETYERILRPELFQLTDHLLILEVALKHGVCFIPEILGTWRVQAGGYAEVSFDDEVVTDTALANIKDRMESSDNKKYFTDKIVKDYIGRCKYSIRLRKYRKLAYDRALFVAKLNDLTVGITVLDHLVFLVIKLLQMTEKILMVTYLQHRRINWNILWLIRVRLSYRLAPKDIDK